MPTSALERGGRIPSLDGLRAVAILLVVAGHVARLPECGWGRFLLRYGDSGRLGVRIFFVISGFLITSLLLAEHRTRGAISLTDFYIRRAFRILPAAYTFIIAIVIAQAADAITLMPGDVLTAALFVTNYHPHVSWFLGHIWSLSVEEQFYLFWPTVLVVVGLTRSVGVGWAIMILAPLLRLAMWLGTPSLRPLIGTSFPTVADALVVGCLLALLRERLDQSARYQLWLHSRWFLLVPLAALVIYLRDDDTTFGAVVGPTIINVALALMIDRAVRVPSDVVGRFLNWAPLCALGRISYSLYLWQQPFLNPHVGGAWYARYPLNLGLALLAALASYHLIEKPFLRLRSRLTTRARPRSSAPPAAAA